MKGALILTVPGIWPLCYSWIGYQQANGSPRALQSKLVDHGFSYAHAPSADGSNLKSVHSSFQMLSE